MNNLTLEQAILEKVRLLPPEQQQTVLDFAEFLGVVGWVKRSETQHQQRFRWVLLARHPTYPLEPGESQVEIVLNT